MNTRGLIDYIEGDFLDVAILSNFHPKMAYVIKQLTTLNSKSFVYMNKVKKTGLHMLKTALRYNGIIRYGDASNQNTLCFSCKRQYKDHADSKCPKFIPYSFIEITG